MSRAHVDFHGSCVPLTNPTIQPQESTANPLAQLWGRVIVVGLNEAKQLGAGHTLIHVVSSVGGRGEHEPCSMVTRDGCLIRLTLIETDQQREDCGFEEPSQGQDFGAKSPPFCPWSGLCEILTMPDARL